MTSLPASFFLDRVRVEAATYKLGFPPLAVSGLSSTLTIHHGPRTSAAKTNDDYRWFSPGIRGSGILLCAAAKSSSRDRGKKERDN